MSKPIFETRRSPIQGLGVFATSLIRKGTRIIEYVGERVSSEEGDRRYAELDTKRSPVLLFRIDDQTAIDAGVGGNDARFINHSCDPNAEPVIQSKRIFIQALRDIRPGEEILYDYSLTRDETDTPETELQYACHCGSPNCRGSMMEPLPKRRRARSKKAKKSKKSK
jgi:SET domain-containing protein